MMGDSDAPQISVATGVIVGLVASFIQSLGLTMQRKSHLQNEALAPPLRKRDWRRPLWATGFAIFLCSNLCGTIFQIGALPIVVLGPLGAVSLLYNAFFARIILGDEFTIHLILGTFLIAGGAVLIGIFGVVPEQNHTLAELVELYTRPAFIVWLSLLSFSILVVVGIAHVTEWALERRLNAEHSASSHIDPLTRTRRTSSLWRKARPPALAHSTSSPLPRYGAFDSTPTPASPRSSAAKRTSFAIQIEQEIGEPGGLVLDEEVVDTAEKGHLSAAAVERSRLVLGVAYGSASGTLSGLCLLFAKTGIELLILTVVGKNQFGQYQAWMIVLVLIVAAVLQLFYLNRALRLVGPTLICPLAFCFYNLSSILSGLIYYDQWDMLTSLQIGLVSLGTAVLLAGVWIVSIRTNKDKPKRSTSRAELIAGPLTEEPESEDSDSETDTGDASAVEWIPRGLTIGLGAASPGFEFVQRRYMAKAKLLPGEGLITLSKHGDQASFTDLAFSYPLKLIAPSRHFFPGVAAVYVISYGGGLVAGDRVRLSVEVTKGSTLVMLTQGSTKVFKTRPGRYLTEAAQPDDATRRAATRQLLDVIVQPASSLFLFPAPVTCFSRASYSQRQIFHLSGTSNLILLDWYTSGRMGMDDVEEWQFERYRSENEVYVDGRRIARDVLLLQDERDELVPGPTSYAARVEPYSCYCTLLVVGPGMAPLLQHLQAAFSSITQYKQSRPYSMLWSFSPLEKGTAGIARCAGDSTETVKDWVVQVLQDGGIQDHIGQDLWKVAFT